MTPFTIWKKVIEAKVHSKEVVTTRVNVVYAVGQLTSDEYTELIQLIEAIYTDTAQ